METSNNLGYDTSHNKTKMSPQYIALVSVFLVLFILAYVLLKEDFKDFITWWLALLALGIGFLPLTGFMFSKFHDNGYLFSKPLGIAVSGYLVWFLSSIRIIKFSSVTCILVVILCFGINIFLFLKSKEELRKNLLSETKIKTMLKEEVLFLLFFLIWTYIRGFKPEAYGTEKFMDYGFMNVMMRSDYMPPKDLWFSGSTINYYYVGQYMATFLTKLTFLKANIGYNLMLMTLAAFGFVLPYSLVYNVIKNHFTEQGNGNKKEKKYFYLFSAFGGVLSGIGVSLASNMHFPLYYWFLPILRTLLGVDIDKGYWFPDSTRYIGYNPDTADKTIHEFPSYSFILGDLHAHVINIMFILTVVGILYAFMLHRKSKLNNLQREARIYPSVKEELLCPHILVIGFFIGLFHTTNFWDFPIYYVVAGAIILFSNLIFYQFSKKAIWITALQGIYIMAIAKITALPFSLNFDQISTEIMLTVSRTPFYQLIILWGLPVVLVAGLFIELMQSNTKQKVLSKISSQEPIEETKMCKMGFWKNFMYGLNTSELFILTLGLCAVGLVLIPEIIYVKDIYSGDYKRANTMFKLTYQAFILFGVSIGFIFIKFFKTRNFRWQKKFGIITFLLFLCSTWYCVVSVKAWYGNIFDTAGYKGLDAAAFLEEKMPDDYMAVNWLNDNVMGTPVVLESNGDSYSDHERISMATGLPTVLGWYVHEWLWRGDTTVLEERAGDIQTIYTAEDNLLVNSLIDKYKIEYIYIGKLEQDKYVTLNHDLLKGLGEIVFESPSTPEKNYESYLVKIDPK
ncbi:hypothetical protein acsn021_30380 [Anaerocolumna cellulosilytica]|uniref:Uncharacterized protein n=1 Tax=Anaerocolumna cellulosilytica TaxID=433286 RepID=A0A6S6R2A3_9FIRM|nr:DUF2298 domain-containing protein [Anaerocolumna cellulosilytica]MBB5197449.1 YYY domain-containing protein [Anaerocolumna cellulosilytica]BCJ95469.1 hypothetical protein acsn021_30380 [Anaerocolumna cellulosilytica]